MKQRPRIYYSATQRSLIWDRWRKGDTIHQIARLFDRFHSSIHGILAETGGIRPAARQRSELAVTLTDREEISRGLVTGSSIRSIAASLSRAPSTISREVRRNGGPGGYRASVADQAAWDRGRRPKVCKLVQNRALAHFVASKLCLEWSPEQIAGWLKRSYPGNDTYQVSHETIYRSLFIQARGALKKELMAHLRRTRGMRRSRHHTQKTSIHGRIVDAVPISERPALVQDRAVPGHWEGDLLFGSENSQIATLVERRSRYLMLAKVDRKDTETVVNALIKHAQKLPRELYKSLTWDRGKEMADHQRFTLATDFQVYFCDPQSPWQRGSTRTRTDYCGNICQRASTSRLTRNPSSMRQPGALTSGRGRHYTSTRQLSDSINPLHRPVESAADLSRSSDDSSRSVADLPASRKQSFKPTTNTEVSLDLQRAKCGRQKTRLRPQVQSAHNPNRSITERAQSCASLRCLSPRIR
jgi:IS30 family transposase